MNVEELPVDVEQFLKEEEVRLQEDQEELKRLRNRKKEKRIWFIGTILVAIIGIFQVEIYRLSSSYTREKARKYKEAKILQEREMYGDAIEIYGSLYGYEDSKVRIEECTTLREDAGIKSKYEAAVKLFENQQYLEAATLFGEIKDYEDASEREKESYYKYGESCVAGVDYESAYAAFHAAGDYGDAAQKAEECQFATVEVGDTLTFGTYEQDGDKENGSEGITWIVVDKEDDKFLLISEEILAVIPFQTEETETLNYESSTIRKFVNETFYNEAFTDEEKSKILSYRINEEDANGNEIGNSDNYVFLPTKKMVDDYLTSSQKTANKTTAANASEKTSSVKSSWWTSSMYLTKGVYCVTNGSTSYYCKAGKELGVRPMIYVDFTRRMEEE